MKDYYRILELSKECSETDIKKAYKKLAFQYHPDKNNAEDAESKFREISEAYDILSNADKRRMYDNFGYDSVSGDIPQINPLDLFQSLFNVDFTGLGEGMNSNIFVFSDLSSMPFGPLQHKMTYNLECSLDELYHGTQKEFHIPHLSRKDNGEAVQKSTKYVINVKRGSRNGDNIVVKEGGNDLYVVEGLTLCEALTGIDINITHLDGPLQVKISDIVKPNQMFQVFNKGMPIKHDNKSLGDGSETEYGNLIIDLQIEFPESLGSKQKDYLKKILVQLERKPEEGKLVHAYYYKGKEEVAKELMNDEEEGGNGCIQQ